MMADKKVTSGSAYLKANNHHYHEKSNQIEKVIFLNILEFYGRFSSLNAGKVRFQE